MTWLPTDFYFYFLIQAKFDFTFYKKLSILSPFKIIALINLRLSFKQKAKS